ncbi:hypothetical protein [Runella limosa]|uniref:hypothetical protein n=1 Tax=Runella limosa TaxID=370978 RepID=UPI00048D96C7|nr:hypothetical protein [Runella limosa]
MRISLNNPFYRKADLLELVGLTSDKNNYKLFRKLLNEEIAHNTGYDRKHTFTEKEKDEILNWFKKKQ